MRLVGMKGEELMTGGGIDVGGLEILSSWGQARWHITSDEDI